MWLGSKLSSEWMNEWMNFIFFDNQACESSAEKRNSAEMDLPVTISVNRVNPLRKFGGVVGVRCLLVLGQPRYYKNVYLLILLESVQYWFTICFTPLFSRPAWNMCECSQTNLPLYLAEVLIALCMWHSCSRTQVTKLFMVTKSVKGHVSFI